MPAVKERQELLQVKGLRLNVREHRCTVDKRELMLTPTEFNILRILLESRGKILSARDISLNLWEDEGYVKSNNLIAVHIRHLREKLGDSPDKPRYIETIWGRGYRILNEKNQPLY